ncbi:unnamed protein product [Moneuplotes crassus]|uniref:HIT-type domain-containing protein n=1 Tax=Euplotes crassus TaxID=5936 RepID=A0AAD2D5K2_EUPCR|nr:unnamed protein product [Moneuplotes crassus]
MEDTELKTRSSARAKKLSQHMKVVDEETRRQVMQSRLDALEGDNLFDNMPDAEPGTNPELEEYELGEAELFKTETPKQLEKKKNASRIQNATRRITRKEANNKSLALGYTNTSSKSGGNKSKRGKLNLPKIFYREFYEEDDMNFPNYLSVVAKPSIYPQRFFCSVCGYHATYSCVRCGMRTCSLKCDETHKETKCIKFAD